VTAPIRLPARSALFFSKMDLGVMMKLPAILSVVRCFLTCVMIACGSTLTHAQQFSADFSGTDAGQVTAHALPSSGKIYVSNAKVRIEASSFPGDYFLIDGEKGAAYLVKPSSHIFMEARQSSPLTRLLIGVEPDNPCGQWQRMAIISGASEQGDSWQCERISEEKIGDRAAVSYHAHSSGEDLVGWIDANLKFPLKIQADKIATLTLANIQEGPQPSNLFEIPANYRKFDPRDLIERIKHSDVWVEEPKLE
jgi:hypothetical protein